MALYPVPVEQSFPLWPYWGSNNRTYCVDSVNGSDNNDGLTWKKPLCHHPEGCEYGTLSAGDHDDR